MAEPLGDGFEVTVSALVEVLIDPTTRKTFAAAADQLGTTSAKAIADPIAKSVSGISKQLSKALSATESRAERDRIVRDAQAGIKAITTAVVTGNEAAAQSGVKLLREMLIQAERTGQATREAAATTARATAEMAGAARAASAGTSEAVGAVDELVAAMKKIFTVTKGNEEAFESFAKVIVAETNKAAKAISEGIVQEQSRQQQTSVLKQQRQIALQQEKAAARERQAVLNASLREEEQARQAANRSILATQKSALSQENAAFNASLQSNLIEEKGFQQRRTALIRAGLDATRSLYKSVASGTSSVIGGAYTLMVNAVRSGESRMTADNRQGLQQRRRQTEQIMQQTVASVRKEQGAIVAAQTQLDRGGVLGAVTGQSRAGAIARGALLGGGIFGGALGIKQALDFESAIADVNKTVDGSAEVMAGLRQGIIDLAKEIPSTREEIAAVAAVAGQLGIEAPNILDFSKVMIDLGNSTNVAAEEAADLLAKFATVTQMNQGEFDRLGSTIVALGNNFAGTEKDIIAMAQRLSSAGALAGLTQPEIVGIANALVTVGIEAEAGGTAFSRAIGEIAKAVGNGSEAVAPFAEVAGRTAESFSALFKSNPAAAISEFVVGLGAVKDEGGNLFQVLDDIGFKEIRLSNAFRSLAGSGDLFTRSLATATTAWQENSALVTEATIRYQTAASRFKITQNIVSDIQRQLGEIIVPLLVGVTSSLEPVLRMAGRAVAALDRNFRTLASVAEPVLDIVRKALLGVATALGALIAVKAGVEVVKLLGLALSTLASPLGVVVLALSGLGAVFGVVFGQSVLLRESLGRVLTNLRKGGAEVARGPFAKIAEAFNAASEAIAKAALYVNIFTSLLIDDEARAAWFRWFGEDPSAENEGVFGFFLRLRRSAERVIGEVIENVQRLVKFIGDVATDPAFETFRRAVLGVAGGLTSLVVGLKAISAARAGLSALSGVAALLGGFATPLGIVAVGFGLVGGALFTLYRQSEPFRNLIDGLFDTLGDLARQVFRAALPALREFAGIVSRSATVALETFGKAVEAVVEFVGSAGFASALGSIGRVIGGIIEGVGRAFSTLVNFLTALARTINELGIFEGLRQGAIVVFGGIASLVGDVFGSITSTVRRAFGNIPWPQVAATAAIGIFSFFRKIGDTVGAFLGSKEFLTTVLTALGVIAGALASAAGGLVTGLLEGLRDSDAGEQVVEFFKELIGRGTDEIGGAGDAIADALKKATIDGLTLALSAAFPPELFRRLFTNPLESALGAAVLVVQALFIGKIVGLFVSGFGRITKAVAGFRLIGAVLGGGLSSVSGQITNVNRKARESEVALKGISRAYGPITATAAKAADTVNRFGNVGKKAAEETAGVTKAVDSQTAALRAGEAAARGQLGIKREESESNKKVAETVGKVTDNYVALAAVIAGGAVAGAGIGAALTADNPLEVIGGITGAITGIGTIAVTTAQVVASAGLTAGLLTGGVGVAILAITAAVTFLVRNKSGVDQAAEAAERVRDVYRDLFGRVLDQSAASGAERTLGILAEVNRGNADSFTELTGAAEVFGVSLERIISSVTGSEDAFAGFRAGADAELQAIDDRLADLTARRDELSSGGGVPNPFGAEEVGVLQPEIDALTERRRLLVDSLADINNIREAYESETAERSAALAIERNLKIVEQERKASVESTLQTQRDQTDALNAQVTALLTIADLEAGRTTADDASRALRQGLRGLVPQFTPGEDGSAPTAALGAGATGAQIDNANDALAIMRERVAQIAQFWADSATTQAEYDANISGDLANYRQVLLDAGATPEIAQRIIDSISEGFVGGSQVIDAFITAASDDIGALQDRLSDAPWIATVLAKADTEEARRALGDFIAEPDTKDIEALFDLGVPKSVLQAFIDNPTEKTIQPILEALNGADEAELAALRAAETKFLTVAVVVDPETLARTRRQIRQNLGSGTFNPLAGVFNNKYGSVVDRPTLTWVGEEKRKEVIIPLTMPQRAAQLYQESGLGNVLARAGVQAPGQRVEPQPAGAPRSDAELAQVVSELQALRTELRADMDERRDNVFQIYGQNDPVPTAREVAATMRRRRRRS